MHVAQAPAHSAPDDCTDTPDTRINPRTDLPRINPRNDLRQCDVDNDVRRLLTTHFERTQRPLQVVLLNFVLAGWTGKDMRLRKHHLGQAANGHLELALLKSLLGAERANRTNMRLFGVGMVFSPPLGLPHPDRTESLQSLAEPLVAHMRSRMPCLYQALDEADIVISNGEGTLHADLSGTVPVNHTSYDAPCPSGHVLPACPGKPVADLLLALWLAKTHFNKTVWLRNTMWHIDPQADAWERAFAPALRSLRLHVPDAGQVRPGELQRGRLGGLRALRPRPLQWRRRRGVPRGEAQTDGHGAVVMRRYKGAHWGRRMGTAL